MLLVIPAYPQALPLYIMVGAQGGLGYGLAAVFGAIPAEVFHGKHYGTIFGTLNLASSSGAACGPWLTGRLYDATGSYAPAFVLAIVLSLVSIAAIWLAAPRKVRVVAGQIPRLQARHTGARQP
jgi:MFS family permease